MKKVILALFILSGVFLQAQSIDYNTKRGYAANGYDVVSYFEGKPTEGLKEISTKYDGINYKFSNQENLKKFKTNPSKYMPQYGGYCAYAVAVSGKKVNINPETYEIRDGKLYLFYNAGRTNTLELWLNESPNELMSKADTNWEKIKKQ
ncbi:YHS domain-containing (seleno)protein [Muricauda sp. MAR_2010_75]|jgi:YHS domain-containing protein|uniref:YHS domain-containing (seleno)protein n=1 Tax=Allomuricauda sp. MAR_2010_75 TaxID=1250232 RepID=UPI00056746EA|nr:YHS domain-containing (seleno)protein [Muricauda sp. MAR_2010_75]